MGTAKVKKIDPQVNPGYAGFQISKALLTADTHEDAETRNRAQQKVEKWTTVLNDLLNGTNLAGSRTPLPDVPSWATLEVLTGGFASGNLLAEGPILDHEIDLANSISQPLDRAVLNKYFISDEGLAYLQSVLKTGRYDISVPEEGALLVVAWLTEKGYTTKARKVLNAIAPWFPRLRFYPKPLETSRRVGSQVSLQSVGDTVTALKKIRPNERILAQKEAINTRAPLYDRIVSLFLDTVKGTVPTLRGSTGPVNGKFPVVGGWPCQIYPKGWMDRANLLLGEFKVKCPTKPKMDKPVKRGSYKSRTMDLLRAQKLESEGGRTLNPKSSLAQIQKLLEKCVSDPKSLTGRDVGMIRMLLARYVAKRGTPESVQCKNLRDAQKATVDHPTYQEISTVVVDRLKVYPADQGLDDVDAVTYPVTADEESASGVRADAQIPKYIYKKVLRSLRDTIEVLVEKGLITSGEVLGQVLPQITSEVRAGCINDPTLRSLYAAIYRAFRRRRSLLLLNLESQVRLEELPWIEEIEQFRNQSPTSEELSKRSLEEVSMLAVTSFPEAILPNKLLQEMKALVKSSGLTLPIVEEVAADIFMGTFTDKFAEAAKISTSFLKDSLYVRYYGIDCDAIDAIKVKPPQKKKTQSYYYRPRGNDDFAKACQSRVALKKLDYWNTAQNGMVIEQEQILTSHNLGVLFSNFGLAKLLGQDKLLEMSKECFVWICKRLQMKNEAWHDKLIQVKNTAYAWRQMVFYLSLVKKSQLRSFITWANKHLSSQPEWFRLTFQPIFDGLKKTTKTGEAPQIQFLGWTSGDKNHWFLQKGSA